MLLALRPAGIAGGVLLCLVGLFPWAYTPALMGDRPDGEGAGMMGTMIFIYVGLPGLALLAISLLAGRRREER